jgi:ubiquinone/menaquinone biosynthesis C-methylase UbiE
VTLSRPRRYGPLARYYDLLSGERVLYRAGRVAAIEALRLRHGDRVLDVGCGTGLNFALLVEAVGPTGQVVGLDASDPMLARARRRIDSNQWQQAQLVTADAGQLDEELTEQIGGPFDAAIFAYSLSIIDNWHAAWAQTLARVRPGGRVAVVDSAYPTGPWSLLAPAAGLMFTVGGGCARAGACGNSPTATPEVPSIGHSKRATSTSLPAR